MENTGALVFFHKNMDLCFLLVSGPDRFLKEIVIERAENLAQHLFVFKANHPAHAFDAAFHEGLGYFAYGESHTAHGGEIEIGIFICGHVRIVGEGGVKMPVEDIFYGPMPADRFRAQLGVSNTGDKVPQFDRVNACLRVVHDFLVAYESAEFCPIAPVLKPFHVFGYVEVSPLDLGVRLVKRSDKTRLVFPDLFFPLMGEVRLDFLVEGVVVVFERSDVIPAVDFQIIRKEIIRIQQTTNARKAVRLSE